VVVVVVVFELESWGVLGRGKERTRWISPCSMLDETRGYNVPHARVPSDPRTSKSRSHWNECEE
jgi:hypothetical protein